ncbi:GntR family transcriptional regulator [Pseudalkalibacillus decolorationis]|uniref:GntR family transcriptional regulator n=1 Tax=Pseudalkalibacillus decolorationis TaxID=163879 RepID=UPI002148ECB6|nr:GntR family transcriptional regulator [Pseudalkalibacillus decolorationis]
MLETAIEVLIREGFSISTILTTSITTQVTNAIREAIVTGEYEPGVKLSEYSLSEYYKVSRTPIREALKQLEREGLVEIIPRVGTCVTTLTELELTELFTVKETMEGLAAGLLAERKNAKEINEVKKAVATMEKAIQTSDHKLYVEANNVFHTAIHEGANNSKLSYLLNLLLNQMPYSRYVYLSIDMPNRIEKSLEEHKAILAAILKGDKYEAERAMREHVRASGEQLKLGIAEKIIKNTDK